MSSTIVAQGAPPLTNQMLDRAIRYLAWIIDAPMPPLHQLLYRQSIIATWQSGSSEEIQKFLELLQQEVQMEQMSSSQRDWACEKAQLQLLPLLRAADDKLSLDLARLYDAAHPPIVPGDPPITRHMLDSAAQMMCFMVKIVGGQALPPDTELIHELTGKVLQKLESCSPEERQEIANAPLAWAELRMTWEQMTSEQRQETIRQVAQETAAALLQRSRQQHEQTGQSTAGKQKSEHWDVQQGFRMSRVMDLMWKYGP